MTRVEALAFRKAVKKSVSNATTDTAKIEVEPFFPKWKSGEYTKGECYTANGQVWECYQSYDNSVYPDINPENSSWNTFNRPLHGESVETAKEFVHPTGTHDIYKKGEYMVWTDGCIYKSIMDNAYSPAEYSQAWQKYKNTKE